LAILRKGSAQADHQILDAITRKSRSIAESLRRLGDDELHKSSQLPEWIRLTIACHLRFGAEALARMTRSALQGEPMAYYPVGREAQRPLTLVPSPGESAQGVVESLALLSDELAEEWSALDIGAWDLELVEPKHNPDLGPIPLGRLPLLRLTEVEVHGTDLGLNLDDWSELFISTVLPMRLEWLNTRRANHRAFDTQLEGSWLLVAVDGPTYRVSVDSGTKAESRPASPYAHARAVIEATSRDLLALLLGRALNAPPAIMGDIAFAEPFSRAFPGP
jgi:Mycothiol maleylpyruvate isomerase N-terminal domain